VFSSLLGVWQAVPYVYADFLSMRAGDEGPRPAVNTRGWIYRAALLGLAIVPLAQVQYPFREVQKYYAVLGAAFIPLLAAVLLLLNGRQKWIGARYRNRPITTIVLVVAIALFATAGVMQVLDRWAK
jgi:hypothetical protein